MEIWKWVIVLYGVANTVGTVIWYTKNFKWAAIKEARKIQKEIAAELGGALQMKYYNITLVLGLIVGIISGIIAWIPLWVWSKFAMKRLEKEMLGETELDRKRFEKIMKQVREDLTGMYK